jgi:hypothetical protein
MGFFPEYLGENITAGSYSIMLTDVGLTPGSTDDRTAALAIYDAQRTLIKNIQVSPSSGVYNLVTPDGKKLSILVCQSNPGYTVASKWADLKVWFEGEVGVPTRVQPVGPICQSPCFAAGDTCVCPVSEVVTQQFVERARELTQAEASKPSTRVSILNHELTKADAEVKEQILKALDSSDPGVSAEAKTMVNSYVDDVLRENQGSPVTVVDGQRSAIENVGVKDEPTQTVSVNIVKRKMLDRNSIREMLAERKSASDIVSKIESSGSESATGGVVVDGIGYAVSASPGTNIKGTLVANENGIPTEVGRVDIETRGGIVGGTISIYNKLLSIGSQ